MGIGERIGRIRQPSWRLRPEVLCSGQIPLPMHGLAPRTVKSASWWSKTRNAAYASTEYHCIACGVAKASAKLRPILEAHEVYDIDWLLGRMEYLETVPLCTCCHGYIHLGRTRWLLETRQITHGRYLTIVQHGDALIKLHGLQRKLDEARDRAAGPQASWGDWRLVIGRKEYKPLYGSFDEYVKATGHKG